MSESTTAPGLELITKVDAVLTVLTDRGEVTAAEIAEATGEPLSSVYRLLQSLTGIGWLERGWKRGTYRLGLLLFTIGSRLEDQLDVREAALPTLRQLLETIGVTSLLCVRRDDRAVCIERLEGQAVRSLAMQLGGSLPLYAGAAPRALLAFLPAQERELLVQATTSRPEDPARPAPKDLEDELEQIRGQGYSISDGDVTPGIAALGAPVFNHRGDLVAAISVSGLRAQILGAQHDRNVGLLLAGANQVAHTLGRRSTESAA